MDILDFFWTFYLNHLSPLWGYFFCHSWKSLDGANTEFVCTFTPYILCPHSVRTFPPVTKKNPSSQCAQLDQFQAHKSTLAGRISYFNGIWVYLHTWGCPYQDAYVLGEGHPLQGVYLHSWGCAYQDTCVLGRGIHYRGCTFIAGGVHTRTHVYWGGASTTGGVPS